MDGAVVQDEWVCGCGLRTPLNAWAIGGCGCKVRGQGQSGREWDWQGDLSGSGITYAYVAKIRTPTNTLELASDLLEFEEADAFTDKYGYALHDKLCSNNLV